jgi:hypothetical protein
MFQTEKADENKDISGQIKIKKGFLEEKYD